MSIAICIIAYNRIDSLRRVLASLEKGYYDEPVTLIISIDKSNTTTVEDFAKQYDWGFGEKRVITHTQNLGLRKHVLKCGDLLKEYEALIVLEDDIYVAKNFYTYAKQCVDKYRGNKDIAGISLYNFTINYHNTKPFVPLHSESDVYLMQCAQSWGQVWMREQWNDFINWYKNHNEEFSIQEHLPRSICLWPKSSWLKYHTKYCVENNKYFVYPYISLTTCFSDIGTHVNRYSTYVQSPLLYGRKNIYKLSPQIRYDAFFENEIIYNILKHTKEDLCIDYYGEKDNRQNKRFWLTRKILPYKILKSYALLLKPYEMNVINEIIGNELFLYDTWAEGTPIGTKRDNELKCWSYQYGIELDFYNSMKRCVKLFLFQLGLRKNI